MSPNMEQILAAVRWLVTAAGGYAIGRGWLTSEQITLIMGVAVAIVPLVWSLFVHTQTNAVKVVDAIPSVAGVVTKPTEEGHALTMAASSSTVAPAGTAAAEALVK